MTRPGYGNLGRAFVVAVMLGGMGADDFATSNALYGDEALTFPSATLQLLVPAVEQTASGTGGTVGTTPMFLPCCP